jgi:peptidoglycan hydrolase-like protein with peptidoglycan-binding domain
VFARRAVSLTACSITITTSLLVATPVMAASSPGSTPRNGKATGAAVLGKRTLHTGMRGRDVALLQRELSALGLATPVDGQFGPTTASNVAKFKRRNSIRPADGMFRTADAIPLYEALNATTAGGAQAINLPDPGAIAGSSPAQPVPLAPGMRAKLMSNGLAQAPAGAPLVVQQIIAAGNRIAKTPYLYAGGHGSWNSPGGYDCSGSVSYALHYAGLLQQSEASGEMETYGRSGVGQWVTLYTNSGHVYMYVAGLRYDTGALSENGSRWSTQKRSNDGFIARHPSGL